MAQTKKVSGTPAKTKKSSTVNSTNNHPTADEMREFYEKNKRRIENFELASDAFTNFRDTSKSTIYTTINNFNKEDSFSGTPFILVLDTNNIIIYGHNMKNKTMFSALRNYKDMKFWKKNPYIEFDTLYEKNIYEIFAVTNTVVYYDENEIILIAKYHPHMEIL